MPFVPVPETVQVNVKGISHGSKAWENVYYVFIDGLNTATLSQGTADGIATQWDTAYTSSGLLGAMSTQWSITETVVTGLGASTDPSLSSVLANNAGTDAAQPLPGQSSLVVTTHTALRGRSFRGRTYLNGWTESQSDGNPSATALSLSGAFYGDLIAAIVSEVAGDLCVVSRYSGTHLVSLPNGTVVKRPTPRTTGLATPITAVTINQRWSTQRRREFN